MDETKLMKPSGTKYVGPEPNLCRTGTKIINLIYLILFTNLCGFQKQISPWIKEHYTRAHAFLAVTCDAASFTELLGSAVALTMRWQTWDDNLRMGIKTAQGERHDQQMSRRRLTWPMGGSEDCGEICWPRGRGSHEGIKLF
jgi:hypothetical protein